MEESPEIVRHSLKNYDDTIADVPHTNARNSHVGTASLFMVSFSIFRSCVGPAPLYVPKGVAEAGAQLSLIIFVMSYGLLYLGLTRLLDCWEWRIRTTGGIVETYPEVAERMRGPYTRLVVSSCVVMLQAGCCVTYFIFVAENFDAIIQKALNCTIPTSYIVFTMALLEMPMACIRRVELLNKANLVANILVCSSLLIITGYAIKGIALNGPAKDIVQYNPSSAYLFVGTAIFSFEGVCSLTLPLANSVTPADRPRFKFTYLMVMLSIVVLYAAFSMTCYYCYGADVEVIVTLSMPQDIFPGSVVRAMYLVAVFISFPLQLYPVSEALEEVISTSSFYSGFLTWIQRIVKKEPPDVTATEEQETENAQLMLLSSRSAQDAVEYGFGCFWRVTVVVLLAGLALALGDSLDHIVALLGSLASAPLALIVPPLMHLTILNSVTRGNIQETEVSRVIDADGGDGQQSMWKLYVSRWVDYGLTACGMVITASTTGLTLSTWSSGASR